MSMVKLDLAKADAKYYSDEAKRAKALAIREELRQNKEDFTGWVNWPTELPAEWMSDMKRVADDVRSKCDNLIVIGIGGSYLGTAAVIEALGGSKPGCPEILYAGNNMSGHYLADFKAVVEDNDVCLCVVSKSGGTMESRLAFSVLKDWMYEKYGREETAKRIVAITDPKKGILREESDKEGYVTFEIPGNIGGRYSAFTPGIMFPLAVAGVDIDTFVKGAKDISLDEEFWQEGIKYAVTRHSLLEAGKKIEVFEYYDPSLRLIGEWCKQLFGESEGKEGKGLFPASLTFSTDLHSMGQFLQEGSQVFFETIFNVLKRDKDVTVPASAGADLAGKSLNEINAMAVKGVMAAHAKAGIQMIKLDIEEISEYGLGQLLYFLMMTSAVTGKLMGIDPFNQPGVEDYKQEIRNLLGQ
jgi:glucose-6-phosphate isomerase